MSNRFFHVLLVVLATILATGCASGQKYGEVADRFPSVPAESGRIFFYRPSGLGAAVKPKIRLNDEVVGISQAKGFIFVDRPAGDYRVACSTEVERAQTLRLQPGDVRYVELQMQMGFFVGRVLPVLVGENEALQKLAKLRYYGDEELLTGAPDN